MSKASEDKDSSATPTKGRARENAPLQIKRHYQKLSPEETNELAGLVADMMVEYIKAKGVPDVKEGAAGSQAHKPDEPT